MAEYWLADFKKKKKYLQPQNLLHQRIKSLDASYLATSQRAKTQPHAQSSSTQIQRTEKQTGHFYIYGDGIMWKLGLNKAPVGQSPRERAIPRKELVQLELREGNATTYTSSK